MIIGISEAESIILRGGVVGIPTETVYGLAVSIRFAGAIKTIYTLKKRPDKKPLSLLVGPDQDLLELADEIPNSYLRLKTFMPGPLTVVLKANKKNVPAIIRAGLDTVGIRIPDHPLLLKLIKKTGPLAAPSANLSDQPPARSAQEVLRCFGRDFPVLDGGPSRLGVASTVIQLKKSRWKILREGAISKQEIATALKTKYKLLT
ncbi:MAG: threonylcarbamoyl-AMP synthase [Deltaproteobacteria bacterium]|nr:threonylcarbamoyl-AMP synthase [Deltaproteobacteria bacterium]